MYAVWGDECEMGLNAKITFFIKSWENDLLFKEIITCDLIIN